MVGILSGAESVFWRTAKQYFAVIIATALVTTLIGFVGSSASAEASAPSGMCRSTGTGLVYESSATLNGFYLSNASRADDSVTGIRIEPVFAKRMYVDAGAGFDANYIAYRVTNSTTATLSDLWVELSGFSAASVVQPASNADTLQQIPSLAAGASVTRYFLMKATGTSDLDQRHHVRIFQGLPSSGAQLTACYNDIKGVQRSIAANANKVTAISIDSQTPALGQLLTVTVTGAPGTVGSGTASPPDLSVMAISPASNAKWPTNALRLEEMDVVVNNVRNTSGCLNANAVSNPNKSATYINTLVIRSFSSCVSNKSTYTATYKFRIVGKASTDPVIKPVASISSGTQIKYTGSYPSTEVTIPLSNATVPISVDKTYLGYTLGANNETVNVNYRIVASSTSGTAQLDALIDEPSASASLVTATFTDATRSSSTAVLKTDITTGSETSWRFSGPFFASTSVPVTLNYTVQYPLASPGAGQEPVTSEFINQAFGVSGSYVVGSDNLVTGVKLQFTKTDTGDVSAPQVTAFDTTREKTSQEISFSPPEKLGADVSIELDGYSSSGLPLSYQTSTPEVCVLSQFENTWTLTTLGPGACIIEASQSGDTEFAAAAPITRTVTVLKGQVISSPGASFEGSFSTTSLLVGATSKLPVTLVSVNTEVCTVSIRKAHDATSGQTEFEIRKGSVAGSCLLVASQLGNEEWGPALDREIIIGIGQSQTISFVSPAQGSVSQTTDSVSVVATSTANTALTGDARLPVSFRSASPAVCSVSQLVVNGEISSGLNTSTGQTTVPLTLNGAGTCVIVASQDGLNNLGENSPYAPAMDVTLSFTVQSVGTTAQQLSITTNFTVTYGDAAQAVTSASRKVSDSSFTNLLVGFSSSSEACAIGTPTLSSGVTSALVNFRAAGSCTITANQAGDDTYAAAQAVTMIITILPKEVTIAGLSITEREYDATTDVQLTGTPRLDGVVAGDTATQVALGGDLSAQYETPDAGAAKSAPLSGATLSGTKSSSYILLATTLTGSVVQKAVSIQATDQTIGVTDAPQCLSFFAVGALQGEDELVSIQCLFGTYDESEPSAGEYTITLLNPDIQGGGTSALANYAITLLTGTLTVTTLETLTLEAPQVEIIYGTDVTAQLNDLNDEGGLKAKNGQGQSVSGSVNYKISGNSVSNQAYAAGEYSLQVEFIPADVESNKDNNGRVKYAQASTTRPLKVIPRKLTTSVSAVSKEYDGTKTAAFSGGTSLVADPSGDGLGVLSGDDVSIEGTVSGEFPSANAGENYDIPITGLSLAGTKRQNYQFAAPTTTRASITPKGLSVRVKNALKLTTDADPTFAFDVDGFVAGEGLDDVTPVAVTRSNTSNAVGQYALSGNGANNNNYRVTFTPGVLYVASIEIDVSEENSVLTDDEVVCSCKGLIPGETVSLTIFSDPTLIDTVEVPADGTCPFANTNIPDSVPDGDHTLVVESTFEDTDGVTLALPVTLASATGGPSEGDPGVIDIGPGASDGSESGSNDSSALANSGANGLSVTGSSMLAMRLLAASTLAVGFTAIILSRRRRTLK